MRDLALLPKAHLHVHLEGAMRPSTLVDLAAAAEVEVPPTGAFGSFDQFIDTYVAACAVLRTEADLRRLVDEVVADAALAGAVWIEPTTYLPNHRERLGADEAVLEIILDELAHASCRHNVGTGLVMSSNRTLDPQIAEDQARLAVRYAADGVVGFGLVNDETNHPPEPFSTAFHIARAGGLLSVPHAGELEGPMSVYGALGALGADRIQHGVRAVEDPELVVRLAESGVCLDVCPTSNVALSVVTDLAHHPLPELLAAGVACSVNADDPLLFGPGLLDEYESCRHEMHLTDEQLAAVAVTSITASGAPDAMKVGATNSVEAWLRTSGADAVA